MKNIVLLLVSVGLFSSLSAEDMGLVTAVVKVAETKIKEDGETARAHQSEVKVDNSKIEAKAEKGNDNLIVGIDGSVVGVGKHVEISNSEILAESKMGNNNKIIGVSGSVVLGAK
jgi:hypothetical protein